MWQNDHCIFVLLNKSYHVLVRVLRISKLTYVDREIWLV